MGMCTGAFCKGPGAAVGVPFSINWWSGCRHTCTAAQSAKALWVHAQTGLSDT
jgi:hypothetical protein